MTCTHPTAPRRKRSGICRACEVEDNRQRRKRDWQKAKKRNTYYGMIRRCYDRSHPSFRNYGARGIGVCRRWRGPGALQRFMADVPDPPSPKHTLDRIRVERGYSPKNVRWRTVGEQNLNRRVNRMIEAQGRVQTLAEWASETGIHKDTIRRRLDKGMEPALALGLRPEEGVPF